MTVLDKERDNIQAACRRIAKILLPSLGFKHFDRDSNMSDALKC